MLVSIGLLTREADEYVLVPEAAWYLVPGKPTYMGNFLLHLMNWQGDRQIAAAIRTGQRPIIKSLTDANLDAVFGEFFAYHRAAPEQSLKDSASMWQTLGITARDGLRVLDFACGSAIATLALCRLHPGVRATLQDRPHVLEIALEIARSLGVASQIEQLPGDMRSVDFGVNLFDVARVRNALYYLGPSEISEVLGRVKRAMKPGGIFVTEDTIAEDNLTKDAYAPVDALFLYALTENGDTYTYSQWQSFLAQAGFINVSREGSRIRAEVPE
jgi:SAM-dependent methyltransferase